MNGVVTGSLGIFVILRQIDMICSKCKKEKDEELKYEQREGFVIGRYDNGDPIWHYIESYICEACFIEKKKWFDDCQKLAPMD